MSTTAIHPTAIVSPQAKLGDGVKVGPYAIVEDHVEIGDNCEIGPHAVIHNYVRMGQGNSIHAHAVIGDLPNDIGFTAKPFETWVEIGDNNVMREFFTIHRSTHAEQPTRLGSNGFLMAHTQISHDCQVGDYATFATSAIIAGHVHLGDRVTLGGNLAVHQFCRIGSYAMCAGFIAIRKDVLPFTMVGGEPVKHYRLNSVGLRRNGIKGDDYKLLEKAYREIRAGDRTLEGFAENEQIRYLKQFLSEDSRRGLTGFVKGKAKIEL